VISFLTNIVDWFSVLARITWA